MKNLPLFSITFALVAIGDLTAQILENQMLNFIFKPLIMTVLAAFFYHQTHTNAGQFDQFILGGLICSWLGDMFLMIDFLNPNLFLAGLGSFLVAHVLYILAYRASVRHHSKPSFLRQNWFYALPLVAFGTFFYVFIVDKLAQLQIPVLIYALVILTMNIFALNRYGRSHPHSFWLIFIGAILFMISDFCIAIHKFVTPLPQSGLLIMSTYILAQYLIVQGSLVHHKAIH